jgi:hypothetical protein
MFSADGSHWFYELATNRASRGSHWPIIQFSLRSLRLCGESAFSALAQNDEPKRPRQALVTREPSTAKNHSAFRARSGFLR